MRCQRSRTASGISAGETETDRSPSFVILMPCSVRSIRRRTALHPHERQLLRRLDERPEAGAPVQAVALDDGRELLDVVRRELPLICLAVPYGCVAEEMVEDALLRLGGEPRPLVQAQDRQVVRVPEVILHERLDRLADLPERAGAAAAHRLRATRLADRVDRRPLQVGVKLERQLAEVLLDERHALILALRGLRLLRASGHPHSYSSPSGSTSRSSSECVAAAAHRLRATRLHSPT